MSNVDTTIDSVRELILNHTAAEVDRAVHEYIRILHGQTGLNMNFLTSLVRRIPGASVRTTCLGINKKTGKKVYERRVWRHRVLRASHITASELFGPERWRW